MDDPVSAHPDGATLRLRVVPRAPRTTVAGAYGAAVKLKVAAPPAEGAANAEVCRYLAAQLGVRTAEVQILVGERSRDKVVLVRGVDAAQLRELVT